MKSSSKLDSTIFKQKMEYVIEQFSYLDARRNNLNQKHWQYNKIFYTSISDSLDLMPQKNYIEIQKKTDT
jgi:hypothetical protein